MDHIPEFEINTYNFAAKDYPFWDPPNKNHFLYILENGHDVYIGETNDIVVRSKDHHKKSDYCYQFQFRLIHVITGRDLTETQAKHYEALLIKLMQIDQKFQVRNRDDGERTFYAAKNEFELGFDRLWPRLAEKGLVNCKEFQTILNSAQFKYSPYTTLTALQQQALNGILNAIHCSDTQRQRDSRRNRPILIRGDAGTGKTVVAATLFYNLKRDSLMKDKRIALVYANPAMREEIKRVFRSVPGMYYKEILSPVDITKSYYDIVICDEAHTLRRNKNLGMYITHFRKGNARLGFDDSGDELDWLIKNSENLVLFYDGQQIAQASDIQAEIFDAKLEIDNGGVRPVELTEQMRIKAGNAYVPYIYRVLYQQETDKIDFPQYEFRLFTSFPSMLEMLQKKEESMGLCRLCSGYGWEWTSRNAPQAPDICIEGVGVWWNRQTGGWAREPGAEKEMGSIYSLVGLDLNYAAVVIGPEVYFDKVSKEIRVDKSNYYDDKVKKGITDQELIQYVLNTYAVLLTRGIYGTYVYTCDDALREYLKKYIPIYTE